MPRLPASTHRLTRPALGAFAALLTACGGGSDSAGGSGGASAGGSGGGGFGNAACGQALRKQWVLDVTRDWYLFPELLPTTVNLNSYETAEQLLDALTAEARAQGKDRNFSYLTTKAAENALFGEGQFVGFGFRNRTDAGNRPFVLDVYEGSPAADAGLRRGDEIVAVDQGSGFVTVASLLVDGRTFSDLMGAAEAGVRRGLRLQRGTTTVDVQMTKRTVTIDPVPDGFGVSVLPLAGTTGVGYLNLRSYVTTADAQLRDAFAQLRARNLQYFIVDLRYNGGGLVSTAELIGNLLGDGRQGTDVQYRMTHNAARSAQDSTVRFQPQPQSVRPVRIAFLTTEATASAAEINVNVMKPWVEVAIVGSDTFGKPVGQLAFDLTGCTDRLRLVSFKTVNARGEGDYYSGLASTMRFACAASDTLGAAMNDPADGLTSAALGWIGTGSCPNGVIAGAGEASQKPGAIRGAFPRPAQPSDAEHWLPGIN
jgi:C-terminal processing protease CtpA/Prc